MCSFNVLVIGIIHRMLVFSTVIGITTGQMITITTGSVVPTTFPSLTFCKGNTGDIGSILSYQLGEILNGLDSSTHGECLYA